jgi:hypothetical protein
MIFLKFSQAGKETWDIFNLFYHGLPLAYSSSPTTKRFILSGKHVILCECLKMTVAKVSALS